MSRERRIFVDLGVDLDSLTTWMDAEALGAGSIANARQLAGGTQNILIRFTRDGCEYVVRRPPPHPRANSNETMRREARLLGALALTAVPHPRLIAVCDDERVLGAVFYLMEPIEGFNPVSALPPLHAGSADVQHRMGLALIEALVTLGSLDHGALGLGDFGKPDGYLERQVARWRSQLDGYAELPGWPGPDGIGDVATIARWLEANRPASFRPGIMHGDFHMANIMYRNDGPELAAVVDWELATIGDPLVDLGWLLATWPEVGEEGAVSVSPWIGFPTASELVNHYRACGGRDVGNIEWYAVFGCYKLGILLEGTYARACAGKAPVDVGQRLHDRSRWLFERAARWVERGLQGMHWEGCRSA
jgi:aminoglycoside phosphotransferase (APT) family kinase protein